MESPNATPHFVASPPRFTTASSDEIRYAELLRRQIEERYFAASHRPSDPYWCIGAD